MIFSALVLAEQCTVATSTERRDAIAFLSNMLLPHPSGPTTIKGSPRSSQGRNMDEFIATSKQGTTGESRSQGDDEIKLSGVKSIVWAGGLLN